MKTQIQVCHWDKDKRKLVKTVHDEIMWADSTTIWAYPGKIEIDHPQWVRPVTVTDYGKIKR